jgi:putative acetyltransferase
MNLVIREFKPGDCPALWSVFFTAIHGRAAKDYTPEQIEAWAPDHPDLERWEVRMAQITPFVAESDGTIVGYADLQGDGYIDHFFVAPAFARHGVGSRLMRHIHEMALRRGTGRFYSNVSITARPFFEKWGFVVESPQLVSIRGVTLTNFRMGKSLAVA